MTDYVLPALLWLAAIGASAWLEFAVRVWREHEKFNTTQHEVTQ